MRPRNIDHTGRGALKNGAGTASSPRLVSRAAFCGDEPSPPLLTHPSNPFIAFVNWRFCFIIPPMKPCSWLMAAVAFFCSLSLRLLAAEPEVTDNDLPRVPPTEPNNAIATFQVKSGFRIELVAAEPKV